MIACLFARRHVRLLPLVGLLIFSGLAQPARSQNATNSYWQAQNIYQVITDRFYDGDASNNNADGNYSATGMTSVHGGDFRGLEQKLDYIKALGATAIWISPVILNANGEFHGYAGRDFYQVDPHWGSLADLQHLVQTAHAKGLLVINDIICNHGGDLVYSTDSGYAAFVSPTNAGYNLKYRSSKQYAAPFNTNAINPNLTNIFHNNGAIPDYNTPEHYQFGELSGLDDFRTEAPYVRSNMAAIYNYWIQNAGFDGFRIDTFKHVDTGFWQYWCPRVHQFAATNSAKPNFFMFGEVYDASESLCGSYTGTKGGGSYELDSVLDYPLYFKLGGVFGSASTATTNLDYHYDQVDALYDTNARMRLVTFLDNHDQPRFLNSSTTNRLGLGLEFLYTSRGVPCLYYGTEQAFNGATDPYDREDMFAGQFKDAGFAGVDSFNMTHPLFQLIARLNNFRRLYPAIALGAQVNLWHTPTPGLFAYSRRLGTQEVFVVFNTAGSTRNLPAQPLTYAPGTALVNLLDPNEIITVTGASQTPVISVPSTMAKIFIAQSQVLPLDPVVTVNYPPHGVTNIPTWSPIVLQFSKPMNTNSVQSAFSVIPAASGAFNWSPANDTLTFSPGIAGFAGLTNIIVRLTNTAVDALSGNALFAPYELKFKTAAFSVHDITPPSVSLQSPANNPVASGTLLISGTATDNLAVAKVEVQVDTGAWATANGTNSWSLSLNSSNFLNGPHLVSARATDTVGNISSTNTAGVIFFNVPGSYLQRVSGGNPSNVTNCDANLWRADLAYSPGAFGYAGGTTGYVASSISGVCAGAQSLYQRERFSTPAGGFYYQFDCPEGIYEITLLEAETYWAGAGQRVFNACIQGRQVLTNFDIYAAAGGLNIPLSRVFTNTVTNSQLQIRFTPVVDNARVSGLQVRKIADVYSDTDGIPDWWRLAYFGHPMGSLADFSRGGDDADGDGVSDLTEFLHGTSPINAGAVPVLAAFSLGGTVVIGPGFQFSCHSTTNWTYQLQRRDTLDGTSAWTNVGTSMSGTGSALLFSDSATNSTRFYRIQAR